MLGHTLGTLWKHPESTLCTLCEQPESTLGALWGLHKLGDVHLHQVKCNPVRVFLKTIFWGEEFLLFACSQ